MAAAWKPGLQASAIGAQASTVFDATTLTWMPRNLTTTHDPGITKETREYERYVRWAAIDLLPGQRVDKVTLSGDLCHLGAVPLLLGAMGVPASGAYKHGGALASAVPKLSARLAKGKYDPTGTLVYVDELYNCRLDQLAIFLESPGGRWQYQANMVGIYNGENSIAASGITFTPGSVFSQGATVATKRLITFRLTLMNAADPMFTTVGANQTNFSQYTQPADFDEGAVGATLDMLLYANEDSVAAYLDFIQNNAAAWTITGTGVSAHSLAFTMPNAKYQTGIIEKNGKLLPRQRLSAIGLYSVADLTGLTAALA